MAAVARRQSVAVGGAGGSAGQCRHRRPTGTLDPREDHWRCAGAEAASLHRQPDDALGSPTGADPSVSPRRSARLVVPRHLRPASRSAPRRGARGRSRAPRRRGLDRPPPTRLRHAADGCGGSRRRAEGGGRQHARAGGGGATRLPDRLHRACCGDGDHPRLSAPRRGRRHGAGGRGDLRRHHVPLGTPSRRKAQARLRPAPRPRAPSHPLPSPCARADECQRAPSPPHSRPQPRRRRPGMLRHGGHLGTPPRPSPFQPADRAGIGVGDAWRGGRCRLYRVQRLPATNGTGNDKADGPSREAPRQGLAAPPRPGRARSPPHRRQRTVDDELSFRLEPRFGMVQTDKPSMPSDPIPFDRLPPPPAGQRLVVTLFAGMAEIVGSRHLEIDWNGGTVADLRREILAARPAIGPLLTRSAVAVAGRYAADDRSIAAGTDVALIPPVSGG
ncbi:MAG: MoaD/ThiS family protein [Planctomycetota bacterium]|nr:MAG: MoaD/ThiS family protein [Planctomycetota bacterium]